MFSKLVRWTPKGLAKWEQNRRGSKKRFVWQFGLSWGIPMFIFMTSFMCIRQYGPTWPSMDNLPVSLVLINTAIWPIAGYWAGSTMWSTMERAYRRNQEETTNG